MRTANRVKNFLAILLVALLAAASVSVTASASSTKYYLSSGFKYSIVDDEIVIKSYYRSTGVEVTVPVTIGGYPVVALRSGAFSLETTPNLRKVLLPDTIRDIEDGAIPEGIVVVRDYNLEEGSYEYIQGATLSGVTSDGYTYENREGVLFITGYEGTERKLTLPSEINGTKVGKLSKGALLNARVDEIRVPQGLEVSKESLSGSYKIILDYDTEDPKYMNGDWTEWVPESEPETETTEEETTEEETTEPETTTETEEETETEETTKEPSSERETVPSRDRNTEREKPSSLTTVDMIILALAAVVFLAAVAAGIIIMVRMKGKKHRNKKRRRS